MTMVNPASSNPKPIYAAAALTYFDSGWRGPLPLPPGAKAPVPTGYTGRAGEWPNGPDIYTWMEDNPAGNIALRLPETVIGIDIDAYPGKKGAYTLVTREHEWGKLPTTWRTTAREDGVSGIRFFTIPAGLAWPNEVGDGIEVVRFAHRYAVVWPSIHPDTGKTYRWLSPDGATRIDGAIPTIDELPNLPTTWVEGLTGGREDTGQAAARRELPEIETFLTLMADGPMCRETNRALTTRAAQLENHADNGARHDTVLAATQRLVHLGAEGHAGIPEALTKLRAAFLKATTGSRKPGEAEAEWDRQLLGAFRHIHTVDATDPCDDPFAGLIDKTPEPVATEPVQEAAQAPVAVEPERHAEEPVTATEAPQAAADNKPYTQLLNQEIERERARREARRIVDEEQGTEPSRPLEFHTISSIRNRPKPEWIVDGLVQGAGVVLLAGEAGLGKSFTCLDIAARVATGLDFFGHKTRQGNVAYVYAEGGEYLPERWDAWEQHNQTTIPEHRLLIVEEGFNLSDPNSVTAMTTEMSNRRLDLLILDTLSQLSTVENENDAAQLARVLTAARTIRTANPGATVLIVHHVNKGEKTRVRGSSVIKSNADAVIVALADRSGDDKFMLSTLPKHDGKQKNAKAEAIGGFYLETVGTSAALARDTPAGLEVVAIQTVLADGEWHAPHEFYIEIGDNTPAMQARVLRRLRDGELGGRYEENGLKTKSKRWRLKPDSDTDSDTKTVNGLM